MIDLLREVFKPVHRHPQKSWHQWTSLKSADPLRPLEHGEDGCGPVVVNNDVIFLLDYDACGYKKTRIIEVN